MIKSYRDLIVWQKATQLVRAVYELTEKFPQSEVYGLTSQMRRCGVSIVSNIAEGSRRGTRKDFRQFLLIAYGSGSELEAQLEIIKVLPFGEDLSQEIASSLLNEIMRMLNVLIRNLESTKSTHYSLLTTH